MATSTAEARCVTCEKETSTFRCNGCLQSFCFNHLADHRQELSLQLDEIQVHRDLFRQTLTDYSNKPYENDHLIRQINQWEQDSINIIKQVAEETRQLLYKQTRELLADIEKKLNELAEELEISRKENNFIERDLQQWKKQLNRMNEELTKQSNIQIKQSSIPLIARINVDVSMESWVIPNINVNAKWIQNGITIVGGNRQGNGLHQLYYPFSICIDNNDIIYIADYGNHRIVEWKIGAKKGRVVAGGNGQGNRNDQLNGPIDVIVDEESDSLIISDYDNRRIMRWPLREGKNGEIIISDVSSYGITMDDEGYLYICDVDKHEVRRWKIGDRNGTVVAGGNGQGNRVDQLSRPCGIFVDIEHSLYIVDQGNHRVMKWMKDAKEGIVVAGTQRQGSSLSQLNYPWGVIVDELGTVYVADQGNHRVMRWCLDAKEGNIVVGRNGEGQRHNQLSNPLNLSFDRHNSLYVVDCSNHRIQMFNVKSN